MEYLSNIIIPASLTNLNLLSYLFLLGKIIFFGYSGVLLVSTYYSMNVKNDDSNLRKEFTNLAAINHPMPYGLGVLPLFSIVLIAFLLMHNIQKEVSALLFFTLIIYILAVILFSIHKKVVNSEIKDRTWGNMSLLMQIIAIYLFSSVSSSMEIRDNWFQQKSIENILVSFNALIDFIQIILFALALTNISFIYKYRINHNVNLEEFKSMNKTALICMTFVFLIFNINFFVINNIGYSALSFVFGVLAIAAIIFQIVSIYFNSERFNFGKSKMSFASTIILFALINMANFSFFAYASEMQVKKLASVYDKKIEEYNLAHNKVEINGGEIYQAKCMACHKFDQKLVGPPHKDIMIKYAGKQEAMVQFILKPTKVDPAYPDMPQQGLTPAEAKAVVEWMYKEYGEKLNK